MIMIKSFTVIGRNNYTVYHIQSYTPSQARQIFKEQTGQSAMKVIQEN